MVGLVASPGPAAELAAGLLPDLPAALAARLPRVRWEVRLVTDRLVEHPADLGHLIEAARRRMLDAGWQLVVCLTDLPLQTAHRPVVAHASATHRVAVLSLPALGPVAVARRAAAAVTRLVVALLGDAGPADVRSGLVTGNLRLLLGMLRANRPWRLAVRLSRALVAALAAAVFALVTSDIWRLADALGALRLSLLTAGSVAAVGLTVVVGAGLWERAPTRDHPPARRQVALFNLVTALTVAIGVLALYLALLALTAAGALLLVPGGLLASALGHRTGPADPLELAWLASSLASLGGALGAGLETDEAVREAAYAYQPDQAVREAGYADQPGERLSADG